MVFSFAFLLPLLVVILPMVIGVGLLVRSKRGAGHPACGGCGYDISGSMGSVVRCPECGALFTEVGIKPPGGRRNRTMVICGIVLIAVSMTCIGGGVLSATMARRAGQAAQQQAAAARARPAVQSTEADSTSPTAPDRAEGGDQ